MTSFFSWEEGLGPFRCYFYDFVYYVLCLGKCLVAFCMILEIKLFPFMVTVSGLCRPWKNTFGWLSGLGCSSFFLELVVLWCESDVFKESIVTF